MHEECGIYGIYSKTEKASLFEECIYGLTKLQHRGQDSCGIGYFINNKLVTEKGIGLVKNVFENYKNMLTTTKIIGHVRYSTSGKKNKKKETQPLCGKDFILAHNGNIPKSIIHDTTFLVNFLNNNKKKNFEDKLINLIETIPGVYCLIIITSSAMYCIRDRKGVRPLFLGKKNNNYVVMSENCAIDKNEFIRDILPGEILKINNDGYKTIYNYKIKNTAFCIFEHIYFLNPKSVVDGYSVIKQRQKLGFYLSKNENFKENDYYVCGVPTSGICSAIEYAKQLNFKYQQIMVKNQNYGRSFIEPTDEKRIEASKNKYIYKNVKNKKIILVDDSIVRGHTMKNIIYTLRNLGALEIHIRVSCPPIKYPCYFGVDFPSTEELVSTNKTIKEICETINADSLKYLSYEYLLKAMNVDITNEKFCTACFNNNYDKELLDW